MHRYLVIISLILIVLAASIPLLEPGMFYTHDFVHGARIIEMQRILADRQIPPRWSQNFGFGYGMPLFEFYSPLPYAIGAALNWVTRNVIVSTKLLFLMATLGTTYAAYALGKRISHTNEAGVLVAATITLAPYRAVNMYVRGALAEVWAMWFVTIILAAVIQILREQRGYWWLGIGLVGLFLSHNLTVVMAGILITIFVILFALVSDFKGHLTSLLNMAKTGLLAIGVSAFYLLPSFFEKSHTQVDSKVLGGYFDYHLHFLYVRQFFLDRWDYQGSGWGPNDGISFFLGYAQWLVLVLGMSYLGWKVITLVLQKSQLKSIFRDQRVVVGFVSALVIGVSLWLTTEKSLFIWELVTIFPYIQFPWRWLGISSVFIGVIAALLGSDAVPQTPRRLFVLVILLISLWQGSLYFRADPNQKNAQPLYYTDPKQIASHMSYILQDYVPKQAKPEDLPIPPLKQIDCYSTLQLQSPIQCFNQTLVHESHQRLWQVEMPESGWVVVNSFDFPGWSVEVEGVEVSKAVLPDGRIALELPKGSAKVGLVWGSTRIRTIADTISAFSVIIVTTLAFKNRFVIEENV